MLRQKCSYRNDIGTGKKAEKQNKSWTKVCNLTKTSKASDLLKMLVYDNLSKKCYIIFKKFSLLLWKFLSYLVCVPSFKSINSSSLCRKNMMAIVSLQPFP